VLNPLVRSLLVSTAIALGSSELAAQQATSVTPLAQSRQYETREQLTARAAVAERQGRSSEAWLLRSRLERGDFQEGDRIVVVLEGTATTVDTLQVRSGKVLQFPRLGDLALTGVLRSELTEAIRAFLSRYLNSPTIRATPLLPIGVFGTVAAPGYYYTPADVVLRDLVMRAGGPTGEADMNKAVIRRGTEVIWKAGDVRVALADGLSLDALHLRAGDEISIPQRRSMDTNTIIALVSTSVALLATILSLSN
jgi:hypothetical protein